MIDCDGRGTDLQMSICLKMWRNFNGNVFVTCLGLFGPVVDKLEGGFTAYPENRNAPDYRQK